MRTMKLFATGCVMLMLALPTLAQPGPGGPGGPGGRGPGGGPGGRGMGMMGGGFGLLTNNADVKAAVGVSEEQVQKIQALQEEFRRNMTPPGGGMGQMSQEEREKAFEAMRKRMDEHQAALKAVLTPEQVKKFNEVRFQISGGLDARGPGLMQSLEALDLSADQKAKMEKIGQEMGEKIRALFPPPGEGGERPSREEMQERMSKVEALQEEMKSQVSGILTAEQKALAAKLTEEGKELRDKVRQQNRERGGRRGGGNGQYRPGNDSWRPGQGAGANGEERPRGGNRRGFPRSE